MKRFFSLLSLLLCFELIVSPVAPSLSLLGQEAYAESCAAGFTWDANLNRCLTKTETANVMNATMNCGNDVECYKKNAEQVFQKNVDEGKAPERKENNQFMSTVGGVAAIAGPLTMAVAGMAKNMSTCTSVSFWAMVGGSAALLVGDTLANFQHKKRLKDIKDEWGKIVNPEQANGDTDKEREISIEAQSQSFEMLAKAEDSLAKAAKMKKTFFTIAALAYGVSTVAAGLEIASDSASLGTTAIGNICKPATSSIDHKQHTFPGQLPPIEKSLFQYYTKNEVNIIGIEHKFYSNLEQSEDLISFLVNRKALEESNQSPSIEYYLSMKKSLSNELPVEEEIFQVFKDFSLSLVKNISPVSNAYAEDSNAAKSFKEDDGKSSNVLVTAAIGGAIGGVAGYAMSAELAAKVITPVTRAAFSGVMTGWTGIMAAHAGSQAEASTKRAELLRKMKDDFASASGAIYACKSEDRNDPSKPNCYCYTPDNQRNSNRGSSAVCQKLWAGRDFTSGNYLSSTTSSKTCINSAGAADSACTCKTSKGGCMKVSLSSLKGVSPGTFSMLSQSLDPVNKISDGTLDAANINTAALDNQAARMIDLSKKMANSKALAKAKKDIDKHARDIKAGLTKAAAGMPSNSLLGSSGSSQMPNNAGEAAAMLEKEVADSEINKIGGNAGTLATPESGSGDPGLDFGLTADQGAAQENQLAEVMKQDLDYGQSDINQGSTTNIFEVLSNRYQRSGMRRLFDEKGITQPEKAASTDISQ